jgi:hypothetical protein
VGNAGGRNSLSFRISHRFGTLAPRHAIASLNAPRFVGSFAQLNRRKQFNAATTLLLLAAVEAYSQR